MKTNLSKKPEGKNIQKVHISYQGSDGTLGLTYSNTLIIWLEPNKLFTMKILQTGNTCIQYEFFQYFYWNMLS